MLLGVPIVHDTLPYIVVGIPVGLGIACIILAIFSHISERADGR